DLVEKPQEEVLKEVAHEEGEEEELLEDDVVVEPDPGADLSDQVPVAKEEVDSICLPEKEVNEEVDQKEEVKQVEQEAKAVELEVEQKEDQEVKE
ncbi:unnamed protein product, partial [Durusdinium trenchii]